MRNLRPLLKLILIISVAAWLSACGGGEINEGMGTLGISLTDSPACGFDEVNVTVKKVRVHQSGSASDTDAGWTDITLNPARKINLLNLNNGVLDSLGETPLPAGHYTQLRLVLDSNTGGTFANSVVPIGGIERSLSTPSAVQSGVKLVHEFDVATGERVDLVLDFNACESIVKSGNGNFALKPVINVIPTLLNGIEGFMDTPLTCSGVMATAQQDDVIVQSTAPVVDTGRFLLARLEPGNYDVVLTADDCATAVIAAVPVASASSITMLSTSGIPIQLPPSTAGIISGTVWLDPPSATVVSKVTAKQSFGTAPMVTVTVKSVSADGATSLFRPVAAYEMTLLPVAAPLFGQYSEALPITLMAQAPLAGSYSLQATANGYESHTVDLVVFTSLNVHGKFAFRLSSIFVDSGLVHCDSDFIRCAGGATVFRDTFNACQRCPCPRPGVLNPPCPDSQGFPIIIAQ